MKKAHLRIVTENQNTKLKAKKLAAFISKELEIETLPKIEEYPKEGYSFKIEFDFELEKPENSIYELIEKADRICSPWILTFDRNNNEIELIFNKYTINHSRYTKEPFNVIAWALMEINN